MKPVKEEQGIYSYDDGDHLDGQPSHFYYLYYCPVCFSKLKENQNCENPKCELKIDWSEKIAGKDES